MIVTHGSDCFSDDDCCAGTWVCSWTGCSCECCWLWGCLSRCLSVVVVVVVVVSGGPMFWYWSLSSFDFSISLFSAILPSSERRPHSPNMQYTMTHRTSYFLKSAHNWWYPLRGNSAQFRDNKIKLLAQETAR